MALVRAFTDASGDDNPSSYWVAVQNNFCSRKGQEAAVVTFYGYKDRASHDAGLQPLSGASKVYSLSGPDFLAVAGGAPVGATLWDVVANAVESHALQTKDTDSGQADAQGKPLLVSFFEGATQTT